VSPWRTPIRRGPERLRRRALPWRPVPPEAFLFGLVGFKRPRPPRPVPAARRPWPCPTTQRVMQAGDPRTQRVKADPPASSGPFYGRWDI